jgi:hypothetical protein
MKTSLGSSVVAAIVALMIVCGCGGSSSLNRAQLIAKADPICRHGNEKLKESKVTPNNISSVAPGIAATYERVSAELAKLTPPSGMAADYKVIVDAWRKAGEAMSRAGRGWEANGSVALRHDVSSFLTAQQVRSTIATRDGFVDCGRY